MQAGPRLIRLALVIGAAAWFALRRRDSAGAAAALPAGGGVYPFDPVVVDRVILPMIGGGETRPLELATAATRELYPVTFSGDAIAWPVASSAPPNLLALQERTRTRARYLVALAAESGAMGVYA